MKNVIFIILIAAFGVGAWFVFSPPSSTRQTTSTPTPHVSTPSPKASGGTATPQPQQAPGTYTMAQVAAHNSAESCWTAVNGSVYDLTSFIDQHPAGPNAILLLCGIDGTDMFNAKHGGQPRPEQELAGLKIGVLAR